MFSQLLHGLFLFTIVFLVYFNPVVAQEEEPPTIQLPCTSEALDSFFCMGSLGNKAALTESGCMVEKSCTVVLIGEHDVSSGKIRWQLMTSLKDGERISVIFYATRGDTEPDRPELRNASFANERCKGGSDSSSACEFCSTYFRLRDPKACVPSGNDYEGPVNGDVVNMDGWNNNPLRRVSFESKTVIETPQYRADFLNDNLWPHFNLVIVEYGNERTTEIAHLSQSVQMFKPCDGDECKLPSSSTTGNGNTGDGSTAPGRTTTGSTDPESTETTTISTNTGSTNDTDGIPKTTAAAYKPTSESEKTRPDVGPDDKPTVPSTDKNNKNVILIGSVIGGIVAFVVIVGLIVFVAKKKSSSRKKKKKKQLYSQNTTIETVDSNLPR